MTEAELAAIEARANAFPSHGQETWWIGDAHDDLLALTAEVRRLQRQVTTLGRENDALHDAWDVLT